MADVDFNHVPSRYNRIRNNFLKMPIHRVNKDLVTEFTDSCLLGLYGAKIGKHRAIKVVGCLRDVCGMLPENKTFLEVTKGDVKDILMKISENQAWGDWQRYTILSVFRKFMTYIRTEHGYPADYPERDKYINSLSVLGCALECKYKNPKCRKLKPVSEIPTAEEINYMLAACDSYEDKNESLRDKTIISMLAEVGMRIGGLGKLKIGDIFFDELGALVSITDKTMAGEPIRLIQSVPHLKRWMRIHPLRNDPDAPLWLNVRMCTERLEMSYEGMRKALKKAVKTHNKLAASKKLPKITRRIHFHAFRYYAQTRDMLDGMPVSIQCLQRGWKPDSKQPMTYARVTTEQADQWLAARYGLAEKVEVINEGSGNKEIRSRQPAPRKEGLPGYL